MKVLLGDTRSHEIVADLQRRGWGRMWVHAKPTPYPGEPWGWDNGAFVDWRLGRDFDGDGYQRRLDRARLVEEPPYLAVLPDIVAGGYASLEFSVAWHETIGDDGWPWYLAVQDGMQAEHLYQYMPQLAGLFLGGTTRFKSSSAWWCQFAHAHGKLFHYGRAGTLNRVADALAMGADSIDSAFPLWERRRLAEFVAATEGRVRQPMLYDPRIVNLIADELLDEYSDTASAPSVSPEPATAGIGQAPLRPPGEADNPDGGMVLAGEGAR